MKLNVKTILAAATLVLPLCAAAQNSRSGYFLDDYTYRFQMNPAYGNSKNFVAMPALGNFNVGLNGTLGVSDVLYNVNGRTTTFLNPGVSAAEVMSNIGDMNRFDVNTRINILSGGFKAWGGYNTISIGARVNAGIKVPGAAFSLLKEGITNDTYHIANLKGQGTAFAEIGLGHSRDIMPGLRVGANLKFLLGAGHFNVDLRKADLTLGTDDWQIVTEGEANVNVKGFKYKTETRTDVPAGQPARTYVNGAEVDGAGLGGFGMALDLGATYTPEVLPDFEFSLALLDLGFINWSNNVLATTNGDKTFNTDKYTFNVDDNAANSFDNEFDILKDDLYRLYELDNAGDTGSKTIGLGATMNAGVLYTLPYYRGLKFGLLNTTRFQGAFTWTDFRLSANVMPCKVFDASVNLSAGTFGMGFGWMANVHCPGFNFFLGMDRTPGKLAKQGVPLNSNADLTLGINFLF